MGYANGSQFKALCGRFLERVFRNPPTMLDSMSIRCSRVRLVRPAKSSHSDGVTYELIANQRGSCRTPLVWGTPFGALVRAIPPRDEARLIQETVKMLPVGERVNAVPEFIQWRSYAVPSRSEKPGFDTRIDRRDDGKWHVLIERPCCVFPSCCTPMQPSTIRTLLPKHPIANGVPAKFTLPETEMYDEPFHVPDPDELIFDESWSGGEHFRSGMLWKLGHGYVFYFRPGHETYHVYTEPMPMKIVENACAYLGSK